MQPTNHAAHTANTTQQSTLSSAITLPRDAALANWITNCLIGAKNRDETVLFLDKDKKRAIMLLYWKPPRNEATDKATANSDNTNHPVFITLKKWVVTKLFQEPSYQDRLPPLSKDNSGRLLTYLEQDHWLDDIIYQFLHQHVPLFSVWCDTWHQLLAEYLAGINVEEGAGSSVSHTTGQMVLDNLCFTQLVQTAHNLLTQLVAQDLGHFYQYHSGAVGLVHGLILINQARTQQPYLELFNLLLELIPEIVNDPELQEFHIAQRKHDLTKITAAFKSLAETIDACVSSASQNFDLKASLTSFAQPELLAALKVVSEVETQVQTCSVLTTLRLLVKTVHNILTTPSYHHRLLPILICLRQQQPQLYLDYVETLIITSSHDDDSLTLPLANIAVQSSARSTPKLQLTFSESELSQILRFIVHTDLSSTEPDLILVALLHNQSLPLLYWLGAQSSMLYILDKAIVKTGLMGAAIYSHHWSELAQKLREQLFILPACGNLAASNCQRRVDDAKTVLPNLIRIIIQHMIGDLVGQMRSRTTPRQPVQSQRRCSDIFDLLAPSLLQLAQGYEMYGSQKAARDNNCTTLEPNRLPVFKTEILLPFLELCWQWEQSSLPFEQCTKQKQGWLSSEWLFHFLQCLLDYNHSKFASCYLSLLKQAKLVSQEIIQYLLTDPVTWHAEKRNRLVVEMLKGHDDLVVSLLSFWTTKPNAKDELDPRIAIVCANPIAILNACLIAVFNSDNPVLIVLFCNLAAKSPKITRAIEQVLLKDVITVPDGQRQLKCTRLMQRLMAGHFELLPQLNTLFVDEVKVLIGKQLAAPLFLAAPDADQAYLYLSAIFDRHDPWLLEYFFSAVEQLPPQRQQQLLADIMDELLDDWNDLLDSQSQPQQPPAHSVSRLGYYLIHGPASCVVAIINFLNQLSPEQCIKCLKIVIARDLPRFTQIAACCYQLAVSSQQQSFSAVLQAYAALFSKQKQTQKENSKKEKPWYEELCKEQRQQIANLLKTAIAADAYGLLNWIIMHQQQELLQFILATLAEDAELLNDTLFPCVTRLIDLTKQHQTDDTRLSCLYGLIQTLAKLLAPVTRLASLKMLITKPFSSTDHAMLLSWVIDQQQPALLKILLETLAGDQQLMLEMVAEYLQGLLKEQNKKQEKQDTEETDQEQRNNGSAQLLQQVASALHTLLKAVAETLLPKKQCGAFLSIIQPADSSGTDLLLWAIHHNQIDLLKIIIRVLVSDSDLNALLNALDKTGRVAQGSYLNYVMLAIQLQQPQSVKTMVSALLRFAEGRKWLISQVLLAHQSLSGEIQGFTALAFCLDNNIGLDNVTVQSCLDYAVELETQNLTLAKEVIRLFASHAEYLPCIRKLCEQQAVDFASDSDSNQDPAIMQLRFYSRMFYELKLGHLSIFKLLINALPQKGGALFVQKLLNACELDYKRDQDLIANLFYYLNQGDVGSVIYDLKTVIKWCLQAPYIVELLQRIYGQSAQAETRQTGVSVNFNLDLLLDCAIELNTAEPLFTIIHIFSHDSERLRYRRFLFCALANSVRACDFVATPIQKQSAAAHVLAPDNYLQYMIVYANYSIFPVIQTFLAPSEQAPVADFVAQIFVQHPTLLANALHLKMTVVNADGPLLKVDNAHLAKMLELFDQILNAIFKNDLSDKIIKTPDLIVDLVTYFSACCFANSYEAKDVAILSNIVHAFRRFPDLLLHIATGCLVQDKNKKAISSYSFTMQDKRIDFIRSVTQLVSVGWLHVTTDPHFFLAKLMVYQKPSNQVNQDAVNQDADQTEAKYQQIMRLACELFDALIATQQGQQVLLWFITRILKNGTKEITIDDIDIFIHNLANNRQIDQSERKEIIEFLSILIQKTGCWTCCLERPEGDEMAPERWEIKILPVEQATKEEKIAANIETSERPDPEVSVHGLWPM